MIFVGGVRPGAEDGGEVPAGRHPQGVDEVPRRGVDGPLVLDEDTAMVGQDECDDVDGVALGVLARNSARLVGARARQAKLEPTSISVSFRPV